MDNNDKKFDSAEADFDLSTIFTEQELFEILNFYQELLRVSLKQEDSHETT